MVALIFGHSIVGTTEGSHKSHIPPVRLQHVFASRLGLARFLRRRLLDRVSATSIASLNFGFFGLAVDTCAQSIVLTALRFSSLTSSGAFGSLSSPSSCLAAHAFVSVSSVPSLKCKNLNCIENLSHLKDGRASSTHFRPVRAAASVSFVALLSDRHVPFEKSVTLETFVCTNRLWRTLTSSSRSTPCETSSSLACWHTLRT